MTDLHNIDSTVSTEYLTTSILKHGNITFDTDAMFHRYLPLLVEIGKVVPLNYVIRRSPTGFTVFIRFNVTIDICFSGRNHFIATLDTIGYNALEYNTAVSISSDIAYWIIDNVEEKRSEYKYVTYNYEYKGIRIGPLIYDYTKRFNKLNRVNLTKTNEQSNYD